MIRLLPKFCIITLVAVVQADSFAGELWIPDNTTGHVGIYDPWSGSFITELVNDHEYNLPCCSMRGPDGLLYLVIHGGGSIKVYDWWGEELGPQVRGLDGDGSPLAGLTFMACGTPKYGANIAAGDIDGNGYDEIITGATSPGTGALLFGVTRLPSAAADINISIC